MLEGINMIFAILLFVASIVLGYFEGSAKVSWVVLHCTALAILLVSNGIANLPFFTADSSAWMRTYVTGFFQTGLVSILVHLGPFYITCFIVLKRSRSAKS